MEVGGEMSVSNTGKKRRERERREREEKTAIIPSGAISEAVETNGRYRKPIRINRDPEIWFRRNTKLFLGRWRRKRKRKKEKGGRDEKILLQIGNLYPDLYPAASSTPVG